MSLTVYWATQLGTALFLVGCMMVLKNPTTFEHDLLVLCTPFLVTFATWLLYLALRSVIRGNIRSSIHHHDRDFKLGYAELLAMHQSNSELQGKIGGLEVLLACRDSQILDLKSTLSKKNAKSHERLLTSVASATALSDARRLLVRKEKHISRFRRVLEFKNNRLKKLESDSATKYREVQNLRQRIVEKNYAISDLRGKTSVKIQELGDAERLSKSQQNTIEDLKSWSSAKDEEIEELKSLLSEETSKRTKLQSLLTDKRLANRKAASFTRYKGPRA